MLATYSLSRIVHTNKESTVVESSNNYSENKISSFYLFAIFRAADRGEWTTRLCIAVTDRERVSHRARSYECVNGVSIKSDTDRVARIAIVSAMSVCQEGLRTGKA